MYKSMLIYFTLGYIDNIPNFISSAYGFTFFCYLILVMPLLFCSCYSRIFASNMRFLLLILSVWLIAQKDVAAQPDSVMHTTYAKRYNYVNELEHVFTRKINEKELRNNSLDSLQKIIDNVKNTGDNAFVYQLTFLRIIIESYTDKVAKTKEMNKLIRQAEKEGYIYEATYAKTQLANRMWHDQNKAMAMEVALGAYSIYVNFTLQEFPERVYAQESLAAWYHYFKEYEKSKKLLLELSKVTRGKMPEILPSPTMTLALTYRGLKQYDSALFYFNYVYNYNGEPKAERKRALAAGNIGVIYYYTGDYDSALLWFKKELAIWKQINNNSSLPSVSDYSTIADVFLKKGDLATAITYIDSADVLIKKVRSAYIDYQKLYTVKAKILTAKGNYVEALRYKDSVVMMMDSSHRVRDKALAIAAEQKVAQAKHEKEVQYLETLRKKSIWLRNFAIVIIFMLAIITSLLINRSRLKHKEKELQAVSEKSNAENKLLQFTRQIQEKNRQIDNMKEELQHISDEQDATAKHETITCLQQSTILTDEQWDEFRNTFEKVYSGFITKLKEKFPALTPAELRYLTLLKLGLSNREMANMLGVNTNTVHNYKSRLRRKYSLADEVQLEDIINNI